MSIDAALTGDQKKVLVAIETGTHTTNWSGIWSSAQSANIKYMKIANAVFLYLPSLSKAQNTASFISMVTVLPSQLRPANNENIKILSIDGGVQVEGEAVVKTTGDISIYATIGAGSFSGSGNGGFSKSTICYNLT